MRTLALVAALITAAGAAVGAADLPFLRPPSVPLATHTPYFCVWSPANRLTDKPTGHWTGRNQPLTGLVRIDGTTFRVMGSQPRTIEALDQIGLTLTPTRSIYRFANAQVELTMTFASPLLCDDLDLLARPVTYVTWEVASKDGRAHDVSVFLAADGALAVNSDNQTVAMQPETIDGMTCLRMGTPDQPVCEKRGDDIRIDWGYGYLATAASNASTGTGPTAALVEAFAASGRLPGATTAEPRRVDDGRPALGVAIALGSGTKAGATHLLSYDEVGSVLYFGEVLKPYWKRTGATMADALTAAHKDQTAIMARCAAFDAEVTADAERLGGPHYAALCTLAWRQAIAANGLAADASGAPLFFPKENHSNGCIATVDVLYPQIPQLLLMSPTLAKAIIVPCADYAASPYWKYPYAPHDLGTYPHATGQVYGMGGPDGGRMPVEECGNMILCFAAIAQVDGDAQFADRWWPQITQWVDYLEKQGFDPGNQLCTDDFAGHLAHNANLSIKSIVAIGAYGKLCGLRGDSAGAAKYTAMAKDFAAKWMQAADDGAKYRLAFDKPGTWSQKYNLAWDRILGLGIFPASVAEKEMAWYRQAQNAYGLPLDSRKGYTKSDWIMWSATLRGGRYEDIAFLAKPLVDAFNEMPQRLPMTDWLETERAHKVGFTARSVVGGYFMPFLTNQELWTKYAKRDKANPKTHIWAPLPKLVEPTVIVPPTAAAQAVWRYTTDKPAEGWSDAAFDDKGWKEGKAGFGTHGTPGATIGTEWRSKDIWMRRTFTLPADAKGRIVPFIIHDDDAQVWIDGKLAGGMTGYTAQPVPMRRVRPEAQALLKPGATVTVAVHCWQDHGGQFIDLGFATLDQ